ncbi:hypothetical protein [Nocardioides sp.]|uniref:hypothetical protein n=1 Tax=Nocardioides sp. TaxID=35761 RepID=UPI002726EC39|nr:hypothetical protein [Nocardioides sp.]MDO9457927.1 hypothetical protein [Nocardioides sp.]
MRVGLEEAAGAKALPGGDGADGVEQVVEVGLPGVAGRVAAEHVAEAVGAVDRGAHGLQVLDELGVDPLADGTEAAGLAQRGTVDEHRAAGDELGVDLDGVAALDRQVALGEVVQLGRHPDELGPRPGPGAEQVGDDVGGVPVVVVHLEQDVTLGRPGGVVQDVAEQRRRAVRPHLHRDAGADGVLHPGDVDLEAVGGEHELEPFDAALAGHLGKGEVEHVLAPGGEQDADAGVGRHGYADPTADLGTPGQGGEPVERGPSEKDAVLLARDRVARIERSSDRVLERCSEKVRRGRRDDGYAGHRQGSRRRGRGRGPVRDLDDAGGPEARDDLGRDHGQGRDVDRGAVGVRREARRVEHPLVERPDATGAGLEGTDVDRHVVGPAADAQPAATEAVAPHRLAPDLGEHVGDVDGRGKAEHRPPAATGPPGAELGEGGPLGSGHQGDGAGAAVEADDAGPDTGDEAAVAWRGDDRDPGVAAGGRVGREQERALPAVEEPAYRRRQPRPPRHPRHVRHRSAPRAGPAGAPAAGASR